MFDEKELKARREQIAKRVMQLEGAIPQMQKEADGLRGQILLINEMLGDDGTPPPPPPKKEPPKKTPAKRKPKPSNLSKKRSKANGK